MQRLFGTVAVALLAGVAWTRGQEKAESHAESAESKPGLEERVRRIEERLGGDPSRLEELKERWEGAEAQEQSVPGTMWEAGAGRAGGADAPSVPGTMWEAGAGRATSVPALEIVGKTCSSSRAASEPNALEEQVPHFDCGGLRPMRARTRLAGRHTRRAIPRPHAAARAVAGRDSRIDRAHAAALAGAARAP